jgi:hypothetical protein
MASPVTDLARVPGTALGRVFGEGRDIWNEGRQLASGRNDDGTERQMTSDELSLAWLLGLMTMAAARVVSWRQAAVIATLQTAERRVRDRRIEEYLEGVQTAL